MKATKNGLSRRRFLQAAALSAVSGSMLGTTGLLQRAQAAATLGTKGSGYRALVCILLEGGADSYNMLVPRLAGTGNPATDYNVYTQTRQNMAVGYNEQNGTWNPGSILTLNGTDMGLNPDMPGMQSLFNSNRLAVVANVGSMIEPVTKSQILGGSANLPPQLFSHSDQSVQWQKAHSDSVENRGWFGRVADLLSSMNAPGPSMNISVIGNNVIQVGQSVFPYSIGTDGPVGIDTGWDPDGNRLATVEALMATADNIYASEHAVIKGRAQDNFEMINAALDAATPLATVFPDTWLGQQLHMVARMIGIRSALGVSRQTFVVGNWGWDTHDGQNANLPGLLQDLDGAAAAFDAALQELNAPGQNNVSSNVTTFTQTEFSRTLNSNGNGTDHGWGGHQFVMGDAVAGGQIYGTLPDLTLEGPDDIDRGRIVPTLSVEQYAATLASWLGVQSGDLANVFPNLGNFSSSDLGFMV
ncbi:MAG: DUF1501 domain-containing protein [Xanthomonadales bacterium]|nr:DUF1501 domain-containing protein [Xanthomonadales bacterium]